MKPLPTPKGEFSSGNFVAAVRPNDLIYFLLNVGDADAQVLLLPEEKIGSGAARRRVIIVDAGIPLGVANPPRDKVPALLTELEAQGILGPGHTSWDAGSIPLVVASHPHLDHIAGIPNILDKYRDAIAEFWDPGYYHTLGEYGETMRALEGSSNVTYAQPTSGLRRWFGDVAVTVLSPSIQLRNRFDSYGVEINDSSISLKVDYPAARVIELDSMRVWLGRKMAVQSLVLGADAQTLSWSYVLADFPFLGASDSAAAKALRAARGADPLRAKVLKVSHHGSKNGINLELVARINPDLTLVSCDAADKNYYFPHDVTQEILREARENIAGSGTARVTKDWQLKLLYTSDLTDASPSEPLGSFGIVLGRSTRRRQVWRFGDKVKEKVTLSNGVQMPSAGLP